MKTEQFRDILKTDFKYQTLPRRQIAIKHIPGLATFRYYANLFGIILINNIFTRIGRFSPERFAEASFKVFRLVELSGGAWHISGLESIARQKRPVVYIANHMSMLDTFVLPCFILGFSNVTFVIKKGLLGYPFFGAILRSLNPIAVTRNNPRRDLKVVLNQGRDILAGGCSIIIFPQATRNPVFDPDTFNSLGVKLAGRAGVPVVPVALKTDFQGNGKIIKEMGIVDPKKNLYLKFGDPLQVQANGQETHRQVTAFIVENLQKWGARVKKNSLKA